jgi:hypothetical protein
LVSRIHAEAIDYKDRAADVSQLKEWLAKGDHGLSKIKAEKIIERQANIRKWNPAQ